MKTLLQLGSGHFKIGPSLVGWIFLIGVGRSISWLCWGNIGTKGKEYG